MIIKSNNLPVYPQPRSHAYLQNKKAHNMITKLQNPNLTDLFDQLIFIFQ